MARDGALNSFLLDGSPSPLITAAAFTKVTGTPWWTAQFDLTNTLALNSPHSLENTVDIFHLGIMHGGAGNGGTYGYFSDFDAIEAKSFVAGTGEPGAKICYGQTIQLVASGGLTYQWIPSTYLSNPFSDEPYCTPYSSIKYEVIVSGASCTPPDTAIVPVNVADSLNARFDMDITQGCAPLTVNFTDYSYGGTKFYWYVNGVLFSSSKYPPPYNFFNTTNAVIVYEIEEEVDNLYCMKLYKRTILVYPQIKAGFNQNVTSGCQPLNVKFTNTSSGNVDTTQYLWNFGDLSQSFKVNPSHTYINQGSKDSTFSITLVATSPFYCRDTAKSTVTVHPMVQTALTIDKSFSCSPLVAKLDPSSSVGVDTFIWQFHYRPGIDSTFKTTSKAARTLNYRNLTHAIPDTLTVTLTGKNKLGGCTNVYPTKSIVVYPEVRANFNANKNTVCDSVPIIFTNNSFGYKLFYNWDFGDGTVFQDTTKLAYTKFFFNRTSASDITYTVKLTATSNYLCSSEDDTIITVHPYINANFGIDYLNNCAPVDVTFNNLSHGVSQYDWDFGDGSAISHTSAASFLHAYWNYSTTNDTTYHIRLVTKNVQGCTDTLKRDMLIYPQVVAAFNMSIANNCSPKTVVLQNNSTGGSLSYLWQFGDNTSSSNALHVFPHTYYNLSQSDTIYYINLNASNPYGCDSTIQNSVNVFASIDANFNLPVLDSCSPFKIRPNNLSSSGAKFFSWDFGPLGTSTLKQPVLAPYTNYTLVPNNVNVSLIAYGANDIPHKACADTITKQVTIYPEVKSSFILDKTESCQPYISGFKNITNIKTGTDFEWRMDGLYFSSAVTPDTIKVPNLVSSDVTHTIKLSAESQYGCKDDTSINIIVDAYISAKFTLDKEAICSGTEVQINSSASTGQIANYFWDFDDGNTSTRSDAPFNYSYIISGSLPETKTISLTVRNQKNCPSTWIQDLSVDPAITAIFTPNSSAVCYPDSIKFLNSSVNIDRSLWDFGDGTGSTEYEPTHDFKNYSLTSDVTYTVKLTARSLYNCLDSITHTVTIYAKPDASFNFDQAIDCPPFTAKMNNTSQGNALNSEWTFPGDSLSNQWEPTWTFWNNDSVIANKEIQLIVTSAMGCKDTANQTLNVYPNVDVDFGRSPVSGCSPLTVDFSGNPTHVDKLFWYINDVAFSTLKNPTYRFDNETNTTQTYNVKFEAYSVYNCKAEATKTIEVYADPTSEFIPDPILQDYNTQTDQTIVTFNNVTRFEDSWQYFWNYGDGNTDNATDVANKHIYGNQFWGDIHNDNKIQVELIAWNNSHPACSDTVFHDIIINPPLPQINLSKDTAGCEPFAVDFSATTKYIYQDQYSWDFGFDNETSTEESPIYIYKVPGVYTAKLVVKGDGGTNWDYKIVTVYPKPDISFSFNDSSVFDSSQTKGYDKINFYNQTKFGNKYAWYFDYNELMDGKDADSYAKDPIWFYKDTGVYYVALVATSDEGCIDTMISKKAITVKGEGYIEFPTGFFVDPSGPADELATDNPSGNPYVFYPATQGVSEYKIEIYDRWGVLVFKSTDAKRGWNGYKNGKPADQGVYVWRVRGRFTNGTPFDKSGNITLLKGKVN